MWFGDPTQFTGPNINNKCKQTILYIVTFNTNFYNNKKNRMLVRAEMLVVLLSLREAVMSFPLVRK